jgi:lipopolysaccharide biosynthesis glycosyltransferase
MNIVYSSSDSYAWLTGISMISLFHNNRNVEDITVYIIDNNITDNNKAKLYQAAAEYKRGLNFVPMPNLKSVTGCEIDVKHWNISTFGKLFVSSVLPENVGKVIYLDCDTIVQTDLTDLWNTDLGTSVIAGVKEALSDNYKVNVGLKKSDTYINAGVNMLNIKKIRQENIDIRFFEFIKKYHGNLHYLDQDVLNGAIANEEKKILPLKYNVYSLLYYLDYNNLIKLRRVTNYYSRSEVEEAKTKSAIVHFTSCFLDGTRPWIEGNKHPLLKDFLYYKSLSPWKEDKLWKDSRCLIKKTGHKSCRVIPKFSMIPIISWVHGVYIPKRYSKNILK